MLSSKNTVVRAFPGLVDDEHGSATAGADVIGPPGAKGHEARPSIVGGERHGEELSELAVEVHGAALGMLDGANQDVGQGAKPLGQKAQGDAFARARVSAVSMAKPPSALPSSMRRTKL
jgi:hypothetical protein